MGRAPCCDKANVKRGPWSPEEDAKLKSYIEQHGTGGNWIALPHKIGLKRCGKSCRLRWLNYLRPNIKHGGFSEEEDNIICSLYISIGSRWSIIAAQLPGRTDNDIKNYWNTRLKKKLLGKQRKEQAEARRVACFKQDIIKAETHSFNMPPDHLQAPYWPELPATMPVTHDSNRFFQFDTNQESIRNLLVKLGGKFSHESNLQFESNFPARAASDNYAIEGSFKQQDPQYGDSLINMPLTSYALNEAYPCLFQASSLDTLPVELDPTPQMEGFDMASVSSTSGSSTTTNSMETINWENVNSLLYQPQVSDQYERCLQSMPLPNSYFEESRYAGSQ